MSQVHTPRSSHYQQPLLTKSWIAEFYGITFIEIFKLNLIGTVFPRQPPLIALQFADKAVMQSNFL
ncbi:MAG: hypothetical protein HRT95_09595 [Moritella sp.]|uniref:hypothetical protein n=1 Tax=Moritella sp. TaxID=78556 RepID=UPI001D566399|nr:hypothetical protein [Moritella sp.]NQZ50411.1 hypothetical protein [Moritella sp.]